MAEDERNEQNPTHAGDFYYGVNAANNGIAQAASVNTYSNGQSSVDICDDSSTYTDSSSGSISLPEGETVTAAAMVVSADSVNYGYAERYDAFSTSYGSFL